MTSLKKPSPLDFKTQYGLALDAADDAIIVDLFAGGGGASTGLEMGLGRKVDLAINHNPAAISMHEANHPHAEHLPTDVWGIDPIEATKGATVGWLHASPDCRHHSQAAGGQPRKKEIRDLSWVVVKWAGKLQKLGRGPWVISLENVKQILQWGPLIAKRDKSTGRVVRLDGTVAGPGERVPRHEQFLVPDPKRKGRTWRQFLRALEGFGYHVDYWVERNCDYGDPTTRQRLYLVATDGGFAPVAAEKTHAAKPGKGLKPYRTAAECIDWSDLGQSIRNRKKPLAEATMRRIAKGIEKEVFQRAKPFIVPIANWSREAVHPVDQPLNTITAWPKGGAFSVATPTLIQVGYGERDGQAPRVLELDEPLGTVVAGGIKHAVAAAHLVKFRFDAAGVPVDEPMPTITSGGECKRPAGAAHALGLASAVLVGAGGGYTTNIDEAETLTRARAVRQYECRETDLPWPVDYVRARVEYGVDHQDLELSRTQALATAPADDRIYVAYDRDWDGNCLVWVPEAAGRTSNLAAARTWPLDHAGILTARGLAPWPKSYIDQHARPVAVAASLNHKRVLRLFGLKLPKPEHQGQRRLSYSTRLNCSGCGRFITEHQRFDDCPNCGARNAP